jgi:Domain of unknown function (DUF4124)
MLLTRICSPTRLSITLLTLLAILFTCPPVLAQFKWKDSAGQWVYSDQPPPSGTKTATQPSRLSDAPSATKVPAASGVEKPNNDDKSLAAKRAELEKQVAAKETKEKQELALKNKAACELTRENLKTVEGDLRVRTTDASGERRFLSDAERQQKSAQAQKDLATYCKG